MHMSFRLVPTSVTLYAVERRNSLNRRVISGVATGWTGVDMSTPLLPEVIPEIDANPMTFLGYEWGGKCKRVGEVVRQSEQLLNF